MYPGLQKHYRQGYGGFEMRVLCKIERPGPTTIDHKKASYTFNPLDPNMPEHEAQMSVGEIINDELLTRLFLDKNWREHVIFNERGSVSEVDADYWDKRQYMPYIPGQLPPSKKETLKLSGFAFEVHGTEQHSTGYRIVNHNAKPKQYAGSDGEWRDNPNVGLVPFGKQTDAFDWLKNEGRHTAKIDKDNPHLEKKHNPLGITNKAAADNEVDALLADTKKKKG